MLGLIPSSPFIKDLDDGTGWTISKFAEDTKLGGVINRPGDCSAIQRDLSKLEKWTNRNLMNFKKREMPSPTPGRNHPKYHHRLGADQLESSLAENKICVSL